MQLAEVSIRRPVLAVVMSLLIVLIGAVSFKSLSLREYPKIRKFLHLIFILMIQQANSSKFVSNEDHLQVALTKLVRAISDMFLLQETVPYDQINRSLEWGMPLQ